MGADSFCVTEQGKTAAEAFRLAVELAEQSYGCCGYTGSIAEKSSFVLIKVDGCPETFLREFHDCPENFPRFIKRYEDKFGPALCVKSGEGSWTFFGLASS